MDKTEAAGNGCVSIILRSLHILPGVCLLATSHKNYWSHLHENFTRDVSLNKKSRLKFPSHPDLDNRDLKKELYHCDIWYIGNANDPQPGLSSSPKIQQARGPQIERSKGCVGKGLHSASAPVDCFVVYNCSLTNCTLYCIIRTVFATELHKYRDNGNPRIPREWKPSLLGSRRGEE